MVFSLRLQPESGERFQSIDDPSIEEFKLQQSPCTTTTNKNVVSKISEDLPRRIRRELQRDEGIERRTRSKSRGRIIADGAMSVVSAALGNSIRNLAQASKPPVATSDTETASEILDETDPAPKKGSWSARFFRISGKLDKDVLMDGTTGLNTKNESTGDDDENLNNYSKSFNRHDRDRSISPRSFHTINSPWRNVSGLHSDGNKSITRQEDENDLSQSIRDIATYHRLNQSVSPIRDRSNRRSSTRRISDAESLNESNFLNSETISPVNNRKPGCSTQMFKDKEGILESPSSYKLARPPSSPRRRRLDSPRKRVTGTRNDSDENQTKTPHGLVSSPPILSINSALLLVPFEDNAERRENKDVYNNSCASLKVSDLEAYEFKCENDSSRNNLPQRNDISDSNARGCSSSYSKIERLAKSWGNLVPHVNEKVIPKHGIPPPSPTRKSRTCNNQYKQLKLTATTKQGEEEEVEVEVFDVRAPSDGKKDATRSNISRDSHKSSWRSLSPTKSSRRGSFGDSCSVGIQSYLSEGPANQMKKAESENGGGKSSGSLEKINKQKGRRESRSTSKSVCGTSELRSSRSECSVPVTALTSNNVKIKETLQQKLDCTFNCIGEVHADKNLDKRTKKLSSSVSCSESVAKCSDNNGSRSKSESLVNERTVTSPRRQKSTGRGDTNRSTKHSRRSENAAADKDNEYKRSSHSPSKSKSSRNSTKTSRSSHEQGSPDREDDPSDLRHKVNPKNSSHTGKSPRRTEKSRSRDTPDSETTEQRESKTGDKDRFKKKEHCTSTRTSKNCLDWIQDELRSDELLSRQRRSRSPSSVKRGSRSKSSGRSRSQSRGRSRSKSPAEATHRSRSSSKGRNSTHRTHSSSKDRRSTRSNSRSRSVISIGQD